MKLRTSIFLSITFTSFLVFPQDQNQNMYRLAQALEQQGDYERALLLYSDLFHADSNNFVFFDAVRRTNIQLKKYEDAVRISLRRLKLTPYDVSLKANIGSLYAMDGNNRTADSLWDAILLSAQKNQLAYRAVANEQTNQRLFDKAIETYLRGRTEIGDPFIFANELGYLYSFMMDFENSTREYLRMLMQNHQQFDFVQSRLSSIVTRTDGLKSATKVVEEELDKNQSIPLVRLHIWLLMEGKRFRDAFLATQTLEQLVHSNGQEMFTFAERIFRESQYDIASNAYQQALKSDARSPFIPMARYGYARCTEELNLLGQIINVPNGNTISSLETQPNFSGAINLYTSLVKEFPYTAVGANALYRIGWIRYRQLYDLDGALKIFDSVLTVSPAGPMLATVLQTIGEIYVAQNQLDAASAAFQRMAMSPYANQDQRSLAQFHLSEIQFFKNNFDSTLSLLAPLTENLKADESNDALLLQFFVTENRFQFTPALQQFAHAELLVRQFKVSEAIAVFRSTIELYPAAPLADDALLKIGELSIHLKKYSDALDAYRTLLEEYKESIEKDRTQFRIGELYQLYMFDKQKAIAAYEVILEKYPYSLFVEEARKRIRLLRGDAI